MTDKIPKNLRATKELVQKARSSFEKGEAALRTSRLESAKGFFQEALKIFKKIGDPQDEGQCLLKLGRTVELMGFYDQARGSYEQALVLFQKVQDRTDLARCKALLGNIGWATGDYANSSRLLDEAMFLFKEVGDIGGQAWIHDLMGNLQLALREDQEAERYYRTAFSLVEEQGENQENRAWNQFHLGALAFHRGDRVQAKERFSEALGFFNRLKDVLGQVATLIHLGEIACDQNDYRESEKNFQKAIQLVIPTQCKPLLADALTGVARLLKAQGNERKAIGLLMVALSHPTCRQQTKDRMVAISVTLEAQFTSREVEGGFLWAKSITIEEMANAWVTSTLPKANGKKSKKD